MEPLPGQMNLSEILTSCLKQRRGGNTLKQENITTNNDVIIRDKRRAFSMIEHEVIDDTNLDPYAFKLYAVLCRYGWRNNGDIVTANITRTKLAAAVGCGITKISYALNVLESRGYIVRQATTRQSMRYVNEYIVLGPEGAAERIEAAKVKLDASKADYRARAVKRFSAVKRLTENDDSHQMTTDLQPLFTKRLTENDDSHQMTIVSQHSLDDGRTVTKRTGDSLDFESLDSKTPPKPPLGEKSTQKTQDQTPEQIKTQGEPQGQSPNFYKLEYSVRQLFDRVDLNAFNAALKKWDAQYGPETVYEECIKAFEWLDDNDKHYQDPISFLGHWLSQVDGPVSDCSCLSNSAESAEETDPSYNLKGRIARAFEGFWAIWPGARDGKEGGRRVFIRRMTRLPNSAARNRAIELLWAALAGLSERLEAGQNFCPSVKRWLLDADMGDTACAY